MKKLLVVALALTLATGVAVAEEKNFWGGLLKKINKIVSRSPSQKTYTSVVGIRGAEEDTASNSLYWKDKDSQDAAASYTEEEISAFKAAVTLAEAGDSQKALGAFNSFLKEFPQSKLCGDAVDAVDQLKQTIAGN